MKGKVIFIVMFFLVYCFGDIYAQNKYSGYLGYGFSPKGHPFDYSQMGDYLQEVSNTCNGGVVLANGSWRDSFSTSGIILKFQKDICHLQPTPFSYVDMVVFGWGTPSKPYTVHLNVPGDSTNNWQIVRLKHYF